MTRGQRLQPSAPRVAGMSLMAPGAAQPDGDQGGAGGTRLCTEDTLCSQLPGTVVGRFSCLRRVPRAGTAPAGTQLCAATSRLPVVLLGVDTREKLV